ncbi:hypothetical protein KQ51_01379 [Candidatus Izimaplasma bacterium HR1]|jgi:hypothetical protein|uniref:hypothetical protein n=1 Tax=Candidatus Izimoplasma sp. HR1 TaxID=1541959 RepID=UPI0004F63448|nr:hypothetical protein KQ51_01379 [Candidatus Izimaplasma bacterium HR1]
MEGNVSSNREKAIGFIKALPEPYKSLSDEKLKKILNISSTYVYKKIQKKETKKTV